MAGYSGLNEDIIGFSPRSSDSDPSLAQRGGWWRRKKGKKSPEKTAARHPQHSGQCHHGSRGRGVPWVERGRGIGRGGPGRGRVQVGPPQGHGRGGPWPTRVARTQSVHGQSSGGGLGRGNPPGCVRSEPGRGRNNNGRGRGRGESERGSGRNEPERGSGRSEPERGSGRNEPVGRGRHDPGNDHSGVEAGSVHYEPGQRVDSWEALHSPPVVPEKKEGNLLADIMAKLDIAESRKQQIPEKELPKGSTSMTEGIRRPPARSHRYLSRDPQAAKQHNLRSTVSSASVPVSFPAAYGGARSKTNVPEMDEKSRKILRELEKDLNSDYDSTDYTTTEESSDDMSVLPLEDIGKPIPRKSLDTERRRSRKRITEKGAQYFERQGLQAVASNPALEKKRQETFVKKQLKKLLKQISVAHAQALKDIKDPTKCIFKRWMLALSENYNVLMHGPGNKYQVMVDFISFNFDKTCFTATVNGDIPGMSLARVLSSIAFDGLKLECVATEPALAVKQIDDFLEPKYSDHLFIFVNNIDAPTLRDEAIQWLFAELATLPKVHLIASCIAEGCPPRMWDLDKLRKFNFIWENVTGLVTRSSDILKAGEEAMSLLYTVYEPLNPKSKNIFKVLVDFQLKEGGASYYLGMKFNVLSQICLSSGVARSPREVRTHLADCLDDNIVLWKRQFDTYAILADRETLKKFQVEMLSQ